ncbi:hypothetical protein SAMN02745163_03228 [Clostridium cavendishii DSM 21758]|uniref:Uncharacterized protein n=1 Tax=Clostridium cavendishii DSM 21758 TaxID=1121302 RepID=A0A1M6PQJ8_9CLOT|nr:hypothetical protein [Clostridium cavendishii]SHK10162.1 hypothetical protein SAMN02745163_03228 [Clostridium cavendishii DSM 21758]
MNNRKNVVLNALSNEDLEKIDGGWIRPGSGFGGLSSVYEAWKWAGGSSVSGGGSGSGSSCTHR